MPDFYDITLPFRTLTMNQLLRTHFRKRRKHLEEIAWYIRTNAMPPPEPFTLARVQVSRYSPRVLDDDGARAIAKGVLDCLQPVSKRHPFGLGFILDDSPSCLSLVVNTIKSSEAKTRIIIERLPC